MCHCKEKLSQQPTWLGLSSFKYQYADKFRSLLTPLLSFLFFYFHFTLRYACIHCDLRCDYNKVPPRSPQAPPEAHRLPQDRRWCKLSMHSCLLPPAADLPEIRWMDRYWWEADLWYTDFLNCLDHHWYWCFRLGRIRCHPHPQWVQALNNGWGKCFQNDLN